MVAVPLCANAAVWGDVTGEGKISTDDARLALRAAIGLEHYEKGSAQFAGADIIADGRITTEDARLILRMAIGLEPKENQYDILRSGSFYIEGDLDGRGTPMKMAVNKELVYMEMDSGDMIFGYLVKTKTTYLLSPADKTYHKLNVLESAAMKGFGLPEPSEIRQMVDDFGFDKMPPLEKADSVTGAKLDGTPCAVYAFNLSDGGKTLVYMYGCRLLAFGAVDADGKTTSVMRFTNVSSTVPELPPKDYKSVSLFDLMASMGGVNG